MKRLASCVVLALMLLTSAVGAQQSTPTPIYTTYTVIKGDTLSSIALRFNTTTNAILSANNLVNPNRIFTGEILHIPVYTPPAAGTTATAAVTATSAATEAPTVQATLAATQAVTVVPSSTPLPSIGFNLGAEVSDLTHLDTLASSGIGWAKVDLLWKLGDPVDSAQTAIEQAHAKALKVLLQISGDPQELANNSTQYETSFDEYLNAVAALAPDAIQVWNDMNVASGWPSGQIDAAAYNKMLTGAYAAIKQGNEQTLVVSGALAQSVIFNGECSPTGCDDVPYLRGMALAGVAKAADCIGIAYTLGSVAPDRTNGDSRGDQTIFYYSTLVSTYANVFPNKPLCFTSIGYLVAPSAEAGSYAWAKNTTAQDQADWLASAALLARQSGRVLLFMVYNLDASSGSPQQDYAILGADKGCTACQALSAALGTSAG